MKMNPGVERVDASSVISRTRLYLKKGWNEVFQARVQGVKNGRTDM